MTHRLVVPSALVELLLAEQTTATLWSVRLGLEARSINKVFDNGGRICSETHRITWSMIFEQNFPILVPPNFWTTQLDLEPTGAPLTKARGSELALTPFSMLIDQEQKKASETEE